jgi:hypothetical protein
MIKPLSALILFICFLHVVQSSKDNSDILHALDKIKKSLLAEEAKPNKIARTSPFCDGFPFCNENPSKKVITDIDNLAVSAPVQEILNQISELEKLLLANIDQDNITASAKIPVQEPTPEVTSTPQNDCSQPGSFKTCNVVADTISGGKFVGRKKREAEGKRMKRQVKDNKLKIVGAVFHGGSFFGRKKRDTLGEVGQAMKGQLIENIANVQAQNITGGTFIDRKKRDTLEAGQKMKRQGNTVNIMSNGVSGGMFEGRKKREAILVRKARQPNTFNLVSATRVKGGQFTGTGNILDGGPFSIDCSSGTGCINRLG